MHTRQDQADHTELAFALRSRFILKQRKSLSCRKLCRYRKRIGGLSRSSSFAYSDNSRHYQACQPRWCQACDSAIRLYQWGCQACDSAIREFARWRLTGHQDLTLTTVSLQNDRIANRRPGTAFTLRLCVNFPCLTQRSQMSLKVAAKWKNRSAWETGTILTTDFLTTFSHLTHCYFNAFSYLATGLTRDPGKFRRRRSSGDFE